MGKILEKGRYLWYNDVNMINGKRLLFLFIILILCAGSFSCGNQLETDNSDNVIEEPSPVEPPPIEPPPVKPPPVVPSPTAYEQFKQKYMTYADEIPVMRINTANGAAITSKTDYVNATINIEGSEKYNKSNWAVEIRGRGNSSWDMPKRPYRIKAVSKTSIFGQPAVKNWALIPNYSDKSLMRNYTALMLGRSLDTMRFTANAIFVEVYLNGRYDGLYCLQDHMEAKPSRVDVEGFRTDGNGNLIDVGFLIEVDWPERNPGDIEGRDYFAIPNGNDLMFFLKYPKYDDDGFENPVFYQQAFNYIRNYVTSVHNVIMSQNQTDIKNLCEWDSFIDYFLVKELSRDVDGGQLSIYFNKKTGGRMQMGPLWDFDLAFGNSDYIPYTTDYSSPEGWYVVRQSSAWRHLPWFQSLMKMNDFYEDFRARFIALSDTNIQYTIDCIDPVRELIRPAALQNFGRWNILNTYIWPNPPGVLARRTWDGQVDYIKEFWSGRNLWMYDQLYYRRSIPGVR